MLARTNAAGTEGCFVDGIAKPLPIKKHAPRTPAGAGGEARENSSTYTKETKTAGARVKMA